MFLIFQCKDSVIVEIKKVLRDYLFPKGYKNVFL